MSHTGFFLLDEMSKLTEADDSYYTEHMEIFVESNKTDQFRDGAWVVLACTNSKLCPVAMTEHYCVLGGVRQVANNTQGQDPVLWNMHHKVSVQTEKVGWLKLHKGTRSDARDARSYRLRQVPIQLA